MIPASPLIPVTAQITKKIRVGGADGNFQEDSREMNSISADSNHCSGHHNLGFTTNETLHLSILLRRFHLTMHLADLAIGKFRTNQFIPLFQILDIHFFTLLYQRINNIDLPPFFYLFANGSIKTGTAIVKLMDSLDGFTARRQFVNN